MKIIFSGTPDFSIPCLEHLFIQYKIEAVITQPDRPVGRGLQISAPTVKTYALKNAIKCFQPNDLEEPSFLNEIETLQPDIIFDCSYGKIFSKELLTIPKMGCINIHPSLLPGYKGPCPMRWVLINGEDHTGVTAHYMTEQIDSGEVIYQKKIDISEEEDYQTLYPKLSCLAVDVIKKCIEQLQKEKTMGHPADTYNIKNFYARKFDRHEFYIEWENSSQDIHNLIRGLKEKPTAHTFYNNKTIKIHESEIVNNFQTTDTYLPGQIVTADKQNGIIIKTKDGFLKIVKLQNQNKKILNAVDYLNGTKLKVKETFENVKNKIL